MIHAFHKNIRALSFNSKDTLANIKFMQSLKRLKCSFYFENYLVQENQILGHQAKILY
jgi:hypothetical protein